MPLKNGNDVVTPFDPVTTTYLAKTKILGRSVDLRRECIKLSVSLQEIDDDVLLKHYKKIKTATVWLSDDE